MDESVVVPPLEEPVASTPPRAQRVLQCAFVAFYTQVPATPLKRITAVNKHVEPSLAVRAIANLAIHYDERGFIIEGVQTLEPFRLKLQNTLRTISPEAAELTYRKGDSRITPRGANGVPTTHTFQSKFNCFLFQLLQTVCRVGHAAGLVSAHQDAEDGRAALLSLINYAEPHLLAELGVSHYLDILCNTRIIGSENP